MTLEEIQKITNERRKRKLNGKKKSEWGIFKIGAPQVEKDLAAVYRERNVNKL